MSERPEQYGDKPAHPQVLSPEERLETLKEIRFDLGTVGEKLRDPMAALDALKIAQAKLKRLIDDAYQETKKG